MNTPALSPEIDRVFLKSNTAHETVHLIDIIRHYNLEDNETLILNGDGYRGFRDGAYAAIVTDRWQELLKACEEYNIEAHILYFGDNKQLVVPKYETSYLETLALSQDILEEDADWQEDLNKLFNL